MIYIIIERSLKPKEKQLLSAIINNLGWQPADYEIVLKDNTTMNSKDTYLILGDIQIDTIQKKVKGKLTDVPVYLPKHKWIDNMIPNYTLEHVLKTPGTFLDFFKNFKKAGRFSEYKEMEAKAKAPRNIRVVKTLTEATFILNNVLVGGIYDFDCDIETRGFDFRNDPILLTGIAWSENDCIIVPQDVVEKGNLEAQKSWKQFFEMIAHKICWTNGKFDIKFFREQLRIQARVDDDLFLMSYAMDERKGIHNLEYQSQECANVEDYKHNIKFETVDMYDPHLIEYLGKDVCYQRIVRKFKEKELDANPDSYKLYKNVLLPGSELLSSVERNGIFVNIPYAKQLQEKYANDIEEAFKDIIAIANEFGFEGKSYAEAVGAKSIPADFNPKSPKQLGYVLFDLLGMPLFKGKRTTDIKAIGFWLINKLKFPAPNMDSFEYVKQSVIDKWLVEGDEITLKRKKLIYTLVFYRRFNKLKSTYIDVVIDKRTEHDRIHASFNLGGTVTGRLSSSGPNLQNIPRRKEIKNMFAIPEGYTLVECDYSQAELRVLAYLAQDPVMLNTYQNNGDLHDDVATQIYGPDFTKEQRVGAKTINFGLAYGRGANSVAEQLNISMGAANKLMDDWFKALPVAGDFIKETRRAPYKKDPTTVFGRTRRFGLTTHKNANKHENEAINFPIQSTASDLTLLSAMAVQRWLEANPQIDARIVNIVHDAIILEVKDELIHEVVPAVKGIMEETPLEKLDNCNLPFKADAEISKKGWGSKEDYVQA